MKNIKKSGSPVFIIQLLAAAAAIISSSCEKKIEKVKVSEIYTLPSITNLNLRTVLNDSGKVQLIMVTPVVETYNNTDAPYSEFRKGIDVLFYDGKKDSVGRVTSRYARYTNKKRLWELKDSVVVVNYESRYRLETEQLFWDQEKDVIFNDRFVKLSNEDQSVFAKGFESDTRLNKRKLKNVSGPLYMNDETQND